MELLGLIGYFLCEFLFLGVTELLADLAARKVKSRNPDIYRTNSLFAFVVYAVIGYVLGAVSVYFFSAHIISDSTLRTINLFIFPAAMGFIMSRIGKNLKESGKLTTYLEGFPHGFGFAFCFAFARYVLAG